MNAENNENAPTQKKFKSEAETSLVPCSSHTG